ncbi:cadherin-like protein 26 [Lampris incognitus]|uniref:cadherin-like protein 26 n=1 Tax=Lampris incognitus TaxID=2546036 RepID=UPI0024B5BC36|nr:cadherin-like protein 26 [Lampris incognitus]
MRTITLSLLTVVLTLSLAERDGNNHKTKDRAKREALSRSKRRWVLSTIELVEEDPGPFPKVTTQMFNDKKDIAPDRKYRISGMGVTEEPLGVFSIDDHTGVVYVHKAIDRETYSFFHIKFDILDRMTGELKDRTLAFDVAIKDINDNAPYFDPALIKANVKENFKEGYLPVRLQAWDTDEDKTPNSTVTISILSQQPSEPKINVVQDAGSKSGQLTFEGCFDYDKSKNYKIIIQAKDHGKPPMSSTATVILNIIDSNSYAPKFKEKTYNGEVLEMEINKEILRVAVEDKDTPKTPGWRATYSIIRGNEEGNYKIETDPETNEGILTVVKGKDFERTTLTTLQIEVQNEEPLFVCGAGAPVKPPPADSVNITIKVIDVNDPPEFEKVLVDVYRREEAEPGEVLNIPKVMDVDSDVNNTRYELIEDPAGWVSIDKKTGKLTAVQRMDRESPFVDKNNIYKVLFIAIDDGVPPATATGTVLIHLGDINDITPKLVNNSIVMCGNKVNKIMVPAKDEDAPPFSGPFTFSLGGEDKTLSQFWKLDPSTGDAGGLVSLKSLAYNNYSVPLVIQDQQGIASAETLEVIVCDCGTGEVCRENLPLSAGLGSPGIGLIIAGLLLFLLLLLLCMCECGGKQFQHIQVQQDEGCQTLIKYNEEGGGSTCQAEPTLILPPFSSTDGQKLSSMQYGSAGFSHSLSLLSDRNLTDHIDRRLSTIEEDHPVYPPCQYAYEGEGSRCNSLDELSMDHLEDDLDFLNDLGSRFKTLGGICHQSMREGDV